MNRLYKYALIITCLFSLFQPLYPDSWNDSADRYWLKGEELKKAEKFSEAAEMYRLSSDEEKKSVSPRKADLQAELGHAALMYEWSGQYSRAIPFYEETLKLNREMQNRENVNVLLNNLGLTYYYVSRYHDALKCYNEIAASMQESGKTPDAVLFNNMALVYKAQGKYRIALDYYNRALVQDKRSGNKGDMAIRLNNIGRVYHAWGSYETAIRYYGDALKIEEELKRKNKISIRLNNIGLVYYDWKRYEEAYGYFTRALKIDRELGRQGDIARNLNNIGLLNHEWGRQKDALKYLDEALKINQKLGLKGNIATNMNNLGLVYYAMRDYRKALDIYKKSIELEKDLGRMDDIARNYNNIGAIYYDLKDYKNAIGYLNRSIQIKENQRLTATGGARLDYLASQMSTYGYLISTYIKNREPAKAFDIIELSKAKHLAEQVGRKLTDESSGLKFISAYRKKLKSDTAVISYANVNDFQELACLAVTREGIHASETDRNSFADNIYSEYEKDINTVFSKLRGLKLKEKKKLPLTGMKKNDKLEKVINYYRHLLSREELSSREEKLVKKISGELYAFLVKPLEKHIKDKTTLVIIPDGILGFIPFETLVMDNGKFMVEKYNIRYTQSLQVSRLIAGRKYSKLRKPLLAFGGAVYQESTYDEDMVDSEDQLKDLRDQLIASMKRGESTSKAYSSLGYTRWSNLPGTLAEVKALKDIEKNAVIRTGMQVNEQSIKKMSMDGELKKYRVIHFATHGIVVPEIPGLSAIILSLSEKEEGKEDGFLRMNEIAELDLNADFVNLSACETGLGKIYGGEGIVGLTQSFLIAGANGISVSLWQISDESTMMFMTGLYRLVKDRGLTYSMAITEMKRRFIKGEAGYGGYRSPFYWASFVYYGVVE